MFEIILERWSGICLHHQKFKETVIAKLEEFEGNNSPEERQIVRRFKTLMTSGSDTVVTKSYDLR